MVSNNVTFGGQAFTNSGSLMIGAGMSVAFQGATVWSNITIGSNAQVVFNQSLVCSNLDVGSNAIVTFGGSATVGSATVLGVVQAGVSSTVTVTTTLSVPTSGFGHLDFSGGRLVVASSGVDMTGTFSITNTWGTQATVGLDFGDDIEIYAPESQMSNFGFLGWGASSTDVIIKSVLGVGGSKAVVVPEGSVLSNRIASVGHPKIWTDFYVRPTLGEAPVGINTNIYTFLCFMDTNGFLNVWNAGAWAACSNDVKGGAMLAMTTNSYTRVTFFLNFDTHREAIFVGGKLAYEQVPFPAGAAIPSYSSFRTESQKGSAYLDNVRITTTAPADMLSVDLDNDGIPDVIEIQGTDSLLVWPLGSVFKIR